MLDADSSYRAGDGANLGAIDETLIETRAKFILSPEQMKWFARLVLPGIQGHSTHVSIPDASPAAMRSRMKSGLIHTYFLFFQEAGLDDEKMDAFNEIIADSTRINGVEAAITQDERSRRLRALLGADGFEKFERGESYLAVEDVTTIARALYFTATPLTAEQGRKLARVLIERKKSLRGKAHPAPGEIWAAVTPQLETLLSPPQMNALKVLQYDDELQAAQREAREAEKAVKSPSGLQKNP